MTNETMYVLISFGVLIGLSIIVALIVIICSYFKSPFEFPYKKFYIDITGTRQPNYADFIDKYLIANKMTELDNHLEILKKWKNACAEKIAKSVFKKKRQQQYDECLDEDKLFIFVFTRTKTRYRQENYVKYPYKVEEQEMAWYYSYATLKNRFNKLSEIGFQATLSDYNSKEQRGLMTKELRESIAIRDNFTCQICGKYMPDGVGLHIDHIVPIAKGGKSVPSNLQVLCSKCNGKKSNKIVQKSDT